jgi:hypothetical protein
MVDPISGFRPFFQQSVLGAARNRGLFYESEYKPCNVNSPGTITQGSGSSGKCSKRILKFRIDCYIGGSRNAQGNPGTLDGYVKQVITRDTAGWIASLLEAAVIVELDRARPGQLRVIA